MVLYIENLAKSTQLLELMTMYKNNTQKHGSTKQSKHEIKETILFIIASKIIKHVGIDLIKVQNLYQENENIVERKFKRS